MRQKRSVSTKKAAKRTTGHAQKRPPIFMKVKNGYCFREVCYYPHRGRRKGAATEADLRRAIEKEKDGVITRVILQTRGEAEP